MRSVSLLAPAVADRSLGRCEAIWHPGNRCRNPADAIHHRLPRARARWGDEHLLDLAGDADNLAHLCRPCHDAAHANPTRAQAACLSGLFGSTHRDDVRAGISVAGEIRTDVAPTDLLVNPVAHLVYYGPHPTYRLRYPQEPAA